MKYVVVSDIACQLSKVGERISELCNSLQIQQSDKLTATYEQIIVDELEHLQVLTLSHTDEILGEEQAEVAVNADEGGSVFAEGDLTSVSENVVEPVAPEDKK